MSLTRIFTFFDRAWACYTQANVYLVSLETGPCGPAAHHREELLREGCGEGEHRGAAESDHGARIGTRYGFPSQYRCHEFANSTPDALVNGHLVRSS